MDIKEQISKYIFDGKYNILIKNENDNEIMEITVYDHENSIYYKNKNEIYYYTFINTLLDEHIKDKYVIIS
jgi:hypothetical protein